MVSRRRKLNFPDTGHAGNYAQRAWDYAQDAIRDKKGQRYCKHVRNAAQRFVNDFDDPDLPFIFDPAHANDACDFIEKLPHVEGQWDSANITLEDAQCFILCNVFGWREPETDNRRFTMVYLEMARKGAKSTLTSAVALYCLTCENEIGPQIVIGATTGQQADKVFLPAKKMVERTQSLRDWKGLDTFARSIVCMDNGGSIQPINAKSSTQDGWNPHVGILDELHAHKDRGLFDVIKSAFGARKNPMMWIVTTAGYNTEGVCFEQRKMVEKVLARKVKADHVFGVIYTLDKNDDPYDPKLWVKANPMIGITPTWRSMLDYAEEAKVSPGVAYEFKTKRLNIWTTAKDAWLNMVHWDACPGAFDRSQMKNLKCYGGLDLASVSDLAAFVLLFVEGLTMYALCRFYLPEETIREHSQRRNLPYQQWVDEGHITVTPGNTIDYEFIEKDVKDSASEFSIEMIGYDPWNATQVVNNLTEEGANMVEVRQGAKSFNEPMNDLEKAIKGKRLHHGDNPVLSWMASNVVARYDANLNKAPDKKNSHEKIDGLVALLIAIHASKLEVEPELDAVAAIG